MNGRDRVGEFASGTAIFRAAHADFTSLSGESDRLQAHYNGSKVIEGCGARWAA
jgi:hypothetical protein